VGPAAPECQPSVDFGRLEYFVLECTYAPLVHLDEIRAVDKCIAFRPEQTHWKVGRALQPELFERLMPNTTLRNCISRTVFDVSSAGSALTIQKLCNSGIFVNDIPAVDQHLMSITSGTVISLCGCGANTPLLAFSLKLQADSLLGGEPMSPAKRNSPLSLIRTTQSPSPSPHKMMQSQPLPPFWQMRDQQPSYMLVCVYADDLNISALPLRMRSIGVMANAPLIVGRSHQPGFFEGLLSVNKPSLTTISRAQFRLEPCSQATGMFTVTCIGMNCFAVENQLLRKGSQVTVSTPVSFDFCVPDEDGSPKTFMQLRLESVLASTEIPDTCFWIELTGSLVQTSVPRSLTWIMGTANGLIVGQAHQKYLLMRTLPEDALEFISSNYFRIETCSLDNIVTFCIVPLSDNPLWLERGTELMEMDANKLMPLLNEDRIHTYTGATDLTPHGPGSRGTLQWVFHCGAP